MLTLLDISTRSEIAERIGKLSGNELPLWGKMTPSQMLCHTADLFRDMLGVRETVIESSAEMIPRIKAFILRDEPFRQDLPAVAPYIQSSDGGGTLPTSFDKDRKTLLELIAEFAATDENFPFRPHAAAGYFTRDEWGLFQWKHLDHHLRQFGM